MILCGGQGTRIRDINEVLPKPMVPIGAYPIVWHIMKTYAAFGVKRFILCLGYKREAFVEYFLHYHARATDITIKLGKNGNITYHDTSGEEDWEVTLADTGDNTMTGGRVAIAAKYLQENDTDFFLTYGDGVANVNITALLEYHYKHKPAITVTAVHPSGRFGEIKLNKGLVTGFHEKPQTEEGLINGGFMVINKTFLEKYLNTDPDLLLEQEPMRRAMKDGQMAAYLHKGFWQCMDTAREYQLLSNLWKKDKAPWTESW
ncbi:MAG: glucose-1-phosphate cytidylyltransferase [Sedimentisphaerales bacterium]|nr:glucose-1-phosphate cytidylyltransferase [Sedimentisphaerales bacterium]